MEIHKFHYNWKLAEANFTKDKGKVFSCFAYAYSDAEGKYAGTAARAAPPVPQSVDSGTS